MRDRQRTTTSEDYYATQILICEARSFATFTLTHNSISLHPAMKVATATTTHFHSAHKYKVYPNLSTTPLHSSITITNTKTGNFSETEIV